MKKFSEKAAFSHQEFERLVKAKDNLILEFNEFELNDKSIKNNESSLDKNVVEKIKELNDLYKSGILTKEEFTKLKKRILE